MSIQSEIELIKDPSRFSRLTILLLEAEFGPDYQAIDDDRGDGGNDGYIFSQKRIFARHCFKKLPKRDLDEEILAKLKSDFAKAVKLRDEGVYAIENWTFLTSYAVSNGVVKEAQKLGKAAGIGISIKGPAYIATLAAKHKHLLSEFPELQQTQILEEMHQRFDSIEGQLPRKVSEEELLLGQVNDLLIQLLSDLALYKKYEVRPYLSAVNQAMSEAHKTAEDYLVTMERLFGQESEYYKGLELLSSELKLASEAHLVLDGGISYKARMDHVEAAYAALCALVRRIGENATFEGIDNMKSEVRQKTLRWLDSMDESFNNYFNDANKYAGKLMRVFAYLFQAHDDTAANRYLKLAADMVELSEENRSGYHDILLSGVASLKQRVRLLNMNDEESAILVAAGKSEGSIHKITTMQTPAGFISVGDKTFGTEKVDAAEAARYLGALESLINKGLVSHTRGMLYSLTAAGWELAAE